MSVTPVLPDIDFALADAPNLHELLDETRKFGTVVPVQYHGEISYLINSHAELREAFADEEHFASRAGYEVIAEPSMGRTLQVMEADEHRVNRLLMSKPFLPSRVRGYVEGLITEEATRRLDALDGKSEIEMVEGFARPFPFSVITRLLGLPVHDEAQFLGWALKIIDFPWDPEGALRARREFEDYLRPLVKLRRENPAEDVLSLLATSELEGKRLEDEEIFAFCMLLFPAGSDTAYKNLGSLLYAILSTPGMRERAKESDQARDDMVLEGLRWMPPTSLLPRRCSADTELGGVALKAGTPMLFGITAANADPDVFPDPRRFDPDRANKNEHLAFGHGEHFCPGSHLARRELETALKLIFERFPDLELIPERPVEFFGCVLRGPRDLWVRPNL
ncbi:MAG: cytochrome P450 [Deltaproteobacteria bacterium]|nr:cytochrome P450 [Deltaproteobacteria bacterium]MBW2360740.1 cytochrome P450 [Deltaproteobacteria bacterium]